MTRSQMIETVARKTGFTEAQVETTMDALFDQIADCLRAGGVLAGEIIQIVGTKLPASTWSSIRARA